MTSGDPLQLEEFSAWITVDGEEVPIYQPLKLEDEKTVTGWVASKIGQKFVVNWRDNLRKTCTSGIVKLDGVDGGGTVLYDKSQPYKDVATKTGVQITTDELRPFQFSSLTLTDNEDAPSISDLSSDLGTIVLTIARVKVLRVVDEIHSQIDIPDDLILHESSKKAGAYRVRLGQLEKTQPRSTVYTDPIDTKPVATFIFKYKPLDVLIADGIAERPRLAAQQNITNTQHQISLSPDRPIVKKEPTKKIKREAAVDTPEVIDISDDDSATGTNSVSQRGKRRRSVEDVQFVKVAKRKVKKERREPFPEGDVVDLT